VKSHSATRARARGIAVVGIVVALLGYLFGWSSFLEVRTISVTGIENARTLTEKKVIRASGVRVGDKLARINSGTVARALRELPEVAKVAVNRKPLHAVEIAITARSIDLAIGNGKGSFLLADATGTTFATVKRAPKGVPVVTGDIRYLRDGMEIYEALPKKLRTRVEKIALPSRGSITLTLRGGLSILWGSTAEESAKLTVLKALLAAPENKRARFIDIATPLTPTVR
jgi:cell division protein FtsQ